MKINEAIENANEWTIRQVWLLSRTVLEFVQDSETGNSKENRTNDDDKSAQYLRMYAMLLKKCGWKGCEVRKDRTAFGNLKYLIKEINMEKLEKMAN